MGIFGGIAGRTGVCWVDLTVRVGVMPGAAREEVGHQGFKEDLFDEGLVGAFDTLGVVQPFWLAL